MNLLNCLYPCSTCTLSLVVSDRTERHANATHFLSSAMWNLSHLINRVRNFVSSVFCSFFHTSSRAFYLIKHCVLQHGSWNKILLSLVTLMHNILCHAAYNTIYLTCRHRLLNFLAYSKHSEKRFFFVGVLFHTAPFICLKNNLSNLRIRNCTVLCCLNLIKSARIQADSGFNLLFMLSDWTALDCDCPNLLLYLAYYCIHSCCIATKSSYMSDI